MDFIERLKWDSAFFGYEVGQFIVTNKKDFNYEKFIQDSMKYKLVYLFSNEELEGKSILLVDKKVILSNKLNLNSSIKESIQDLKFSFFDKEMHNYDELRKLALESGAFSRFRVDVNFKNGEYDRLYERWIFTSVNDVDKTEVLVAVNSNNEILGFVTLNEKTKKIAEIGLVAVSVKARGIGIGGKIIREVLNRASERGFEKVLVVTQEENKPAINLYESVNFEIKNITHVYHHWNL